MFAKQTWESSLLLYYITDRSQFSGTEAERRARLLDRIGEAAAAGIDLVQLREKDLSARALARLASEALERTHLPGHKTKLLINSRTDVALAVGADGVHLTSHDLRASEARAIALQAGSFDGRKFLVGVSCHSIPELRLAEADGADFTVLAPIFEKIHIEKIHIGEVGEKMTQQAGIGLTALREATGIAETADKRAEAAERAPTHRILALGGVSLENAAACLAAGAAGIAGIRLFQQGDIEDTVRRLRAL